MTVDMSNLSLASPYPTNETIQTANGEGLQVSHIGNSIIHTPAHPIKLHSVLYVPKLTQNLLSVHRICLDNNCWLIFDGLSLMDKGINHRLQFFSDGQGHCTSQVLSIHT